MANKETEEKYVLNGDSGLSYDGKAYWHNYGRVKAAVRGLKELPLEVRRRVREMLIEAAEGAVGAHRAIFDPLIDPDKIKEVTEVANGGANDWHTDMKGLDTMLDEIFEGNNP